MGCLAINYMFQDDTKSVLVCLVVANLADFLDGWVARALKVEGSIGKELDSLADMVSFGVVPGFLIFFMLQGFCETETHWLCHFAYLPFLGFIITLASAYRLAKFNVLTDSSDRFIGLATPANTIFFLGLYLIVSTDQFEINEYVFNPVVLLIFTILFSYLLLSNLELCKLKFDKLGWNGYRRQWILLASAIPTFIFLKEGALSFLILLYIMLSLSRYIRFGR